MLIDPVGYFDFLCLISNSALVMIDLDGIQEETTILDIPCMTFRENTERLMTIEQSTNRLVHITTENIIKNYREIRINGKNCYYTVPNYGMEKLQIESLKSLWIRIIIRGKKLCVCNVNKKHIYRDKV